MLENDVTLAAMAEALAKSANYRVLRRLVPRTTLSPSIGQSTKTGILLDVEPALGLLQPRMSCEAFHGYQVASDCFANRSMSQAAAGPGGASVRWIACMA